MEVLGIGKNMFSCLGWLSEHLVFRVVIVFFFVPCLTYTNVHL